jgi:hypothetical protein
MLSHTTTSRKRRINDALRAAYPGPEDGNRIAFFCECNAESCLAAVWLTGTDYDLACSDATWVALEPGHVADAHPEWSLPWFVREKEEAAGA